MATNYTWDVENTVPTCVRNPILQYMFPHCQRFVHPINIFPVPNMKFLAGIAATLGAVAAGMVLGWTSPAGESLSKDYNNITITEAEFSWIGSLTTLGAGVICIPIGILADLIGRKTAMLLMVIPFSIGWLLIIFSNSVYMFYFGRFITGLSSGAFCVAAPLYTSEIAESEIRGALGSYFQLMLTVGILLTYVLGTVLYIVESM